MGSNIINVILAMFLGIICVSKDQKTTSLYQKHFMFFEQMRMFSGFYCPLKFLPRD